MKLTHILNQILTENVYDSRVISKGIGSNIKKTTKGGGPVIMAIKTKSGAAEVIARVWYDKINKKFQSETPTENGSVEYFAWSAKMSAKDNMWKFTTYNDRTGIFNFPYTIGSKLTDEQMNLSFIQPFFNKIK